MKTTGIQRTPKIALVYDKVNTPYGGAEVVLSALTQLFPNAPLYTSIYDEKKARWANQIQVKTSFLQKLTFLTKNHKLLLPLMPLAFESLDLSEYEVIISITSAEAKGVITKPHQTHICYLLTPTRYLHSHSEKYLSSHTMLSWPVISWFAKKTHEYLRTWDLTAALRPDQIIPISKLVKKRVQTFYNRTCEAVIYPPVAVTVSQKELAELPVLSDQFFLSVSRLVGYKRVDLSIKACLKLGKTLVVVGAGEEKANLLATAGEAAIQKNAEETLTEFFQRANNSNKTILFTGKLSDKSVHTLFANCQAVLMPGKEDFGITALEAGIFGKPVVVFYTSGVSEILTENKHSVFIRKETVSELTYALGKIDSLEFSANELRSNAEKYSVTQFQKEFRKKIEQELKGQYVLS